MIIAEKQQTDFLRGGGKMGEYIRSKDWTETSLGTPAEWPNNLRNALSIVLNSKHPMFLTWGKEHICFFNDACQLLTGNQEVHSIGVGSKGPESWKEIWPLIKPLVEIALLDGEPGREEDLHQTILINGQPEDVYWSFSYTPVRNESGVPEGVIFECDQMVGSIVTINKAEEEQVNLRSLIAHSPVAMCILIGPSFILEMANDLMYNLWGRTEDELLHKPIFETLPEAAAEGLHEIMATVYKTGKRYSDSELRVPLPRNGIREDVYINFIYDAFRGPGGEIRGVTAVAVDVTDQVNARLAVEEGQERYRSLIETMDQGFCIIDIILDENNMPVNYRFLEYNPVFETQTGLKDAIGKTALELVPNLEAHWFELYGNVALTGQSTRFVEGSAAMKRWFEVYAYKVDGAESSKVALLFTDISERRQAEELKSQTEKNLRNIILQAPVAMLVLRGEDMVFDILNKNMLSLLDKTIDIVGKKFLEGLPELTGQPLIHLLQKVYQTGESIHRHEFLIKLMRNGVLEDRFFDFAYTALVEADEIVGITVVANEVTQQVLTKLRIEASNKEFKMVTDIIPQMVWVTKPDGNHDFYNQQWYDYTGLSFEETKDAGWNDVVHPDDSKRAWKTWNNSITTGESYEIEYRLRRFDGTYRWFLGRALPLIDDFGSIQKWFGTCTDIHDQKKVSELMEEKVRERTSDLMEANADLQRVNEELEQLTYVSHHDLQEPLRKIMIFGEMVKSENLDSLPKAAVNRLDKVINAAKLMSGALKDVLDYASLSKKEQFIRLDLDDILAAVVTDLEGTINEKNAKITSDNLPVIQAIPAQVYKLFSNLLMNALKFSKPGIPPQIEIRSGIVHPDVNKNETGSEDKMYYEISIKDNGIGFSEPMAEKIFGIFQRLHGKEEFEGTGIGLAICKKVVTNHGGKIWANSNMDDGATFRMILPAE